MSVRTMILTEAQLLEAADAKAASGLRVSLCIPCRNEAATVPTIITQVISALMNVERSVIDEVIVMDDGSTDATAAVAAAAGARVVRVGDVMTSVPPGWGKGNVLWESVAASTGDVIVWCDGDLLSFTPDYLRRLVAPFVLDPTVMFVKGFYERLLDAAGEGGGRNTELVARPALALLFPELADVLQPLGGEYAGRRSVLEAVPFEMGYGVEIGLLIDIARVCGAAAIAQVDLGVRRHRHRPLRELSPQAAEILHAVLRRIDRGLAGDHGRTFTLPVSGRGGVAIQIGQRPALVELQR